MHGNEYALKEHIRADAALSSHEHFRRLYSFAAMFYIMLCKIDVRGAFTQGMPAKRDVYMKPPRELGKVNNVWLLLHSSYGLTGTRCK